MAVMGLAEELPPQTIISVPVHTALCAKRAGGALNVGTAVHTCVTGS